MTHNEGQEGSQTVEAARSGTPGSVDFLSIMAHELNNAVLPLRLHAEILAEESGIHPRNAASVSAIRDASDRLATLAAEMMETARLHTGRLRLSYSPFDLHDAARKVHAAYAPMATARGVTFRLEPHAACPVIADASRLHQVLANLVSNALNATPKGGRITVEVRNVGNEAVVRVTDTGIGFGARDASRLFLPYATGLDAKYAKGGTGLGLYICRGFVEAHGGRITAESPGPGQGAAFTFTLPTVPPVTAPGETH